MESGDMMKTPRFWILGITLTVAACSDADDALGPRLMGDAVAAIPPTNNTACNKFWATAVSGNWTDPTKWNPAGVPTNASSVCINVAGTYTVTLPGGGTSADTTIADVLALDVGGAGATPTLVTTSGYAAINVAEGVIVQANAILRLNNSQSGVINAAQTFTNLGTLESIAPCGGGCAKDHVINADVINNGTIFINGGALKLNKTDGEYQNTGTLNIANGTILIPATAGNASFSQDAGEINGPSNFTIFTVRSGTFFMNGGKVRSRNAGTGFKPAVIVDGANLVLSAAATDSATIGVLGSSTASANITGNIADLTVLWLAGPADLNPGTISFLDAAPVNHGRIRLGTIDGGQGDLTLGGTGRLTNADSIHANVSGSTDTYEFALELTNNGSMFLLQSVFFTKPGGTYYNAGLIAGSGTVNIAGNTLVNTATGTVSPIGTSGTPRFNVDGGRLIGVGTSGQITLVNGGTLEPGLSPGILNATNLVMNPGTSLAIELGGTQPGTGYDQLNMALTQSFSAGGSVDLTEINGFLSGICGQVFEILSWNSTNSGPATFTGLTPAATRALRVFTHTATLPRKTILYGFDPTQKISVAPNPVAIAEGGPGVQYAVCLDGAPALGAGQTVTVTPTPNAQVTVSPPSVTFTSTNWRAPQFFTVTAVDDILNEGNHTGTVTHASTSSVAAYNGVAIASLTANITDNDVPPPSSTTTSVSSNNNPSTAGQSVTFTATVASSGGTPDGSVQFSIDGNNVGSAVTLVGGQAQFTTSTLTLGNHGVQATYSGSSGFLGSNGALAGGQQVNAITTITAVGSSLNPSTFGQPVTFTATVSSGGGTPTGSVQFNIDNVDVGSPVALDANGQATHLASSLGGGSHAVKATYAANGNFGGSFGALVGGQTVNPAGTSTAVASNNNPSDVGQSVTFTATVTSSAGTPTGNVQFNIDNTNVGGPVALNASGQATFTTTSLTVGNHVVKATYAASTNYATSFGTLSGGQVVNSGNSSTAVGSSANPSTFGQSVTFTATVSGALGTPTGTVQFNIDNSNVGSPVTLDGNGQATFATAILSAGNHAVSATYSGGGSYSGSVGTLAGGQDVNQASTSTAVSSSADPSTFGQSVTFTATVSSGAGTPGGTVQWNIDNSDVGSPVALVSGQATFNTSTLGAGNHVIKATYSGAANFAGSNGTLAGGQDVNQAGTTTAVSSNNNPSGSGQSVTFTATVSSAAGTPSGNVQFNIDNANVGAPVALDVNGQATFATSSLTPGNHAIKATYAGSTNFSGSFGTLAGGQTVNNANSITAIGSSANPSTFGQSVTFTATVTGSLGTPTGTVQFNIDNSDVGAPVTLNASGQATFATSTLGAGNHAVKATYSGNSSYGGSFGTLSGGQNVSQAGTTTGVTSSLNPSTNGQSVTFTATVGSGAGTPGGTVQFNIDNTDVGSPVVLVGGQAQFSTSSLGSGTHTVMATYSGAANYSGSNGTLAGGQVVNGTPSSTATSTAASITATPQYSDMARLRADVTPHTVGSSEVTGTVHFYMGAGAVSCGSSAPAGEIGNDVIAASDNGVAYIDRQLLGASGSSTLTACFYSTNTDFLSSDGSVAVNVGKENARVQPAATNVAAVLATGATPSASFSLVFRLREWNPEPDENAGALPGDVDNAGLTVNLLAVGSGTNNKSVTCSPSAAIATPPSYLDIKTFTCNFTGVAVDAYEVSAVVTGSYYTGGYADALTVYDPNAGSVSGGGKFVYSSTSSDVVSFALSYAFTGNNKPRGNLVAIRHLANGDECRSKSNGIGAPAVNGNAASFSGKGNYVCTRPDGSTYDGAGNLSFVGWVQDNGEGSNATGPDRVWLKIDAPNSKLAMPAPASTNARPLTNGNVQVK